MVELKENNNYSVDKKIIQKTRKIARQGSNREETMKGNFAK